MAWEKIDDEIIAYLSGDLTPVEEKAFEKRLEEEPVLAEALKRHRNFEDGLREYGSYQQKWDEIEQLNQQFSPRKPNRQKYGLIAAAVFALLIAIIWFIIPEKQYCPEELYAESLKVKLAPSIAGNRPSTEQLLAEAHSQFNNQDYDKAILLYRDLASSDQLLPEKQAEVQFFLGYSFILKQDFNQAIKQLQQVPEPYSQLAEWNSALAYLSLGELEKSKKILEVISQDPLHDEYKGAVALLKKWEKLKVCDFL